ncbi:aminoacyltransferase [Bifidobacterium miconisargentati]|uniref:aminoacyltransferase n=1 Tax=Bifidobacterium miconisargentati TaxID=2834437 RepID=UPI001BDD338F|nr:aminoacyltransferase [Bifidobacterium miconisargentati]MBW3089661.1 aminoacyltransferase [Bifidobacterium miconisargentati]
MRDFVLVRLSDDEFDEFSAKHPQGNFQQTSAMGRLRAAQGVDVEYLAVKEHDDIVAAALFETHRSRLSTFAAIHDGPMVDYHDVELLTFLMTQLKAHAKAKGASQLEITPETPYRLRDSDGQPLLAGAEGAQPDDALLSNLESIGFRHGGFTVGYTAVPRWRYLKDLTGIETESDLLKSYDKRTQWSVKRARSMGVHVRELADDELGVFAAIEQQTAERRSFEYRGEEYFHRFKKAFGAKAHFMVAEIHIDEYVKDMTAKREALAAKVESLTAKNAEHPTTKTERQLGEESRNLAAAEKRLKEAAELAKKGDVLPAAASLFVEHPRETIYLFSGSVEEYKPFYASALIQHEAMLHLCLERGVSRYNFYGIDGVFDDPDDEGRGVLEFKQGFNGYVEELPGEFELTVKPLAYALKQLAHKVLSR